MKRVVQLTPLILIIAGAIAVSPVDGKTKNNNPVIPQFKTIAGVDLVYIPGGSFTMGGVRGDANASGDEFPQHRVTVSAFYIGKYEITQQQYASVTGKNPSTFRGNNVPVETVSWYDAVEFCNKLSIKAGLIPCYIIQKDVIDAANESEFDTVKWLVTVNPSGNGFRLPTEAEWEYACRAGTQTSFAWGTAATDAYQYANVYDISGSRKWSEIYPDWRRIGCDDGYADTAPVGSFRPNRFGVYDMIGNVWEWCFDWSDTSYYTKLTEESQTSEIINPQGPVKGSYRILRGGSWADNRRGARPAYRHYLWTNYRYCTNGIRVVCPAGN